MKAIYFSDKTNHSSLVPKVLDSSTYYLTKFSPKLSTQLALKLLCNPRSRREYAFKTKIKPKTIPIKTKLGEVSLFKFEGGKKHVLLSHGWADSSKRFTELIDSLVDQGFTVWSLDHIGHGKSFGKTSHLFGFVDGLSNALNYIEKNGLNVEALVGHSMGSLAVLNLSEIELKNKKIVMVSAPSKFFEFMFKRITESGLSAHMLTNLLKSVSHIYKKNWEDLSPHIHAHKINKEYLIVHDKKDLVCSYENLKELITGQEYNFHSTEGLGHLKILKDKDTLNKITTFIKG